MKTLLSSLCASLALFATQTAALAVTASDPGTSPNDTALEPYLVTWLLPVSGALAFGVMVAVDRRVRAMHAGTARKL